MHDLIDRYRQEITPAKKSRDQEGVRLARLMRDPIASFTVQKLTAHEMALFRDRRIKDGLRKIDQNQQKAAGSMKQKRFIYLIMLITPRLEGLRFRSLVYPM